MRILSHGAIVKMTYVAIGGHFSTVIIEKQVLFNNFTNYDGRVANTNSLL